MRISRRRSLKGLAAAAVLPANAVPTHRSRPPAIRLVILDIGGTIIEDRGDIPQELRRALANHGVESTPAGISRWRGASKRAIIRHFVDQQSLPAGANRDQMTAAIYDEFTARIIEVYRSVPPISGAEAAIRELGRNGYLVAATTGFDRAITMSIFRRIGWEGMFASTVCSDDVTQGRPSPFMLFHALEESRVNSVAEVVAVGDTPLDLQAGKNAGLRGVIGVLSGVSTAETLRREPHTHILPSVATLPALLASKF